MGAQKGRESRSPKLEIRLLGRFEVLRDGEPIPEGAWGRRKTKTLLKILLTDPGRVFTQDQLIEALFGGENADNARENLYGRVSQLRRALEPDLKRGVDSRFVLRKEQGYCFSADALCGIDTLEFQKHLEQGERYQRDGSPLKGVEEYEEAIRLYHGEFLEADRYEEWALETREEWQDWYITALTRLAEGYANLGDWHRAATACHEAFRLQPWRESVLQQLMGYHHTAGERSEALRIYEKGVEALEKRLGVKPSAETEELRKQVETQVFARTEAVRVKTRIAVLPLVNMSSDPDDEYFADGITEELIYLLSQIRDLKVIAQTSVLAYKNTKKTIAQIGRELSIGTVIEGSVRKDQDRVRITIQLIDVGSEEHLWSQEYDHTFRDIFSIQTDIAERVTRALRMQLLEEDTERIEVEPSTSLEAYTLYLKGRHFFLRALYDENFSKAISCFEEALEVDVNYPLAWAGLADAQCLSWFFCNVGDESLATARQAANRATELAPQRAEGHASQAFVSWIGDGDLDAAERLFRKALELAPRNASIRLWYARLLNQQLRRGEALIETLKAHEIDPLSPISNLELSKRFASDGRIEDAAKNLEQILEVHPRNVNARLSLALLREKQWDWSGAETEFQKALELAPRSSMLHIEYAELLICLGRRSEGEFHLEQAIDLSGDEPTSAIQEEVARTYMFLGDFSQALQFAEQAAAISPRIRLAPWMIALCQAVLGNYNEALDALSRSQVMIHGFYRTPWTYMKLWVTFLRGFICLQMGARAEAQDVLTDLGAFPKEVSDLNLVTALLHFELGNLDNGFKHLDQALDARDSTLMQLPGFPIPQDARKDPRYMATLKQMGLRNGDHAEA